MLGWLPGITRLTGAYLYIGDARDALQHAIRGSLSIDRGILYLIYNAMQLNGPYGFPSMIS